MRAFVIYSNNIRNVGKRVDVHAQINRRVHQYLKSARVHNPTAFSLDQLPPEKHALVKFCISTRRETSDEHVRPWIEDIELSPRPSEEIKAIIACLAYNVKSLGWIDECEQVSIPVLGGSLV